MSKKGRVVYSTDPDWEPESVRSRVRKDVPPNQQTVYVARDRKGRGGKTVTVISGLQHDPSTLAKLLKQFKRLCGAGGTLKEETLEIQGDHRDALMEKLREMGYQVKQKGG
ncbi:MAG: translation initiation factor [Chloroflexota bacterium]|nr:translation initiation factor [Chloroflexota bacterium]